jgi:hypothetical protein
MCGIALRHHQRPRPGETPENATCMPSQARDLPLPKAFSQIFPTGEKPCGSGQLLTMARNLL